VGGGQGGEGLDPNEGGWGDAEVDLDFDEDWGVGAEPQTKQVLNTDTHAKSDEFRARGGNGNGNEGEDEDGSRSRGGRLEVTALGPPTGLGSSQVSTRGAGAMREAKYRSLGASIASMGGSSIVIPDDEIYA